MNIVIFSNSFWNIYNFRLHLVKFFLNKGYIVHLIAKEDEYSKALSDIGCNIIPVFFQPNKINLILDFILLTKLFFILKKYKPNYIFTFTIKPNIYTSLISQFLGIKIINNITGLGTTFINKSFINYFIILLYKISLRKSFHIFFQNYSDLKEFINNKIVLKQNHSVLPGSGIDIKQFNFKSTQTKNNLQISFLFFGRLLLDKGILEYIKAAEIIKKNFKNINFDILGFIDENNNRSIKKELLQKYHEQKIINYLGETKNIISYLKKYDCVILPSYREGTPRSLLESAAMYRPLIASNVPGCKNLVLEGKNGFLFEVKNVLSLVESINKFINLPYETRLKFGNESRNLVVKKYDINKVLVAYYNIINNN